jgi:hypothetical protein
VEYENAIILSYGSLVEILMKHCRFIHLSVKEFLRSKNPSTIECTQSMAQSTLEIAAGCLKYLTFKIPQKPLSGTLGVGSSAQEINEKFPFLLYASGFWLQHVYDATLCNTVQDDIVTASDPIRDLLSTMDAFLGSKLKVRAWIECIYILKSTERYINDLDLWSGYGRNQIFKDGRPGLFQLAKKAQSLHQDLNVLDNAWRKVLTRVLVEIWGDVTAFSKSGFWQSTEATEVHSLAALSPFKGSVSSSPLCTVSQLSSSGFELGVLSIWPSK